jgi:hypothetical protein
VRRPAEAKRALLDMKARKSGIRRKDHFTKEKPLRKISPLERNSFLVKMCQENAERHIFGVHNLSLHPNSKTSTLSHTSLGSALVGFGRIQDRVQKAGLAASGVTRDIQWNREPARNNIFGIFNRRLKKLERGEINSNL